MSIRVRLTSGTESDLQTIYPYLDRHAEVGHADHVLDRLEETLEALADFPLRDVFRRSWLTSGSWSIGKFPSLRTE